MDDLTTQRLVSENGTVAHARAPLNPVNNLIFTSGTAYLGDGRVSLSELMIYLNAGLEGQNYESTSAGLKTTTSHLAWFD